MKTLRDLIDESVGNMTGGTVGNDLMQAAVDKIANERNETAIDTCKGLIQYHSGVLKEYVRRLRELRDLEAKQQAVVKKVDQAFRFFQETGNPFPLFLAENSAAKKRDGQSMKFCAGLNLEIPAEDSDAWEIPSDWKPSKVFGF